MFWCKHFAVLAFLLALSVSSNASSQDKSTTAAAETTQDEDTIDLTSPADLTTEKDEDERGAGQIVGQSLFTPVLGQSILPTPLNLFSAMFPALNSLLLMGNLFPATSLLGAPSLLGSTHQLGAAGSDEMPADSKVVLVLAEDRNPNAAMRAAHQEAARTIRQNDMFSQFLAQFGQADFGQMLAQSLEQMQQQNPNQLLQQNAGQLLQQFVPQDFSQTMGQLLSQTFQQFPGLDLSQLPMLGQAPPSADPSVGSSLPEAEGEAVSSAAGAAPQAPTGFQIPNFQSALDAGTQLLGQALQQPNSDSSSGFQLPNFQSALDAGTQMLGQAFQQANADAASSGFQLPNFQSVIDTSNQMLSQGGSLFNLRPLQSLDPSTSASDAEPAASQVSEVRVKPDTISIADHDQKMQEDVNMDELKMTSALQKALLHKKLPILWFRIPADSSENVHDLEMKEPNASKVKNAEEKQLQTRLQAFQRQVMTELKLLQDIERQAKEMRAASLGSKLQSFKDDANANTHTSMLSKIPIHKITRSDIEKALNDDYVKKLLHKAAIANRKEVGKMPIYPPSGVNIKRHTSKSTMAPRQMSRDDIVRLMAYAYRMASDNGIRMLESSESKKPSSDPELGGNQASGDTPKTTERKWPSDAKTPMNRQWLDEENLNSDAKAFKQDPKLMQMRQMWAEPQPQVAIQQPMMMQQMPLPMMQQPEMPQMVAKQAPMELQQMPMSMMQQQQMPQMVAQQAPKEMQHIPMPIMQQPHMSAPQAPMEMRHMSSAMQEPRMVAQQTPMEQIQEPQMVAQQAPMQIQQMPMLMMQQQQIPQMAAQQVPMEIQQMPITMMQQQQMPQMVAQQVPMEIQQMPMPMMQQQHMIAQQAPMEMRQMSRTMQEPWTVAQQIPMIMQNPRIAMQELPMLRQHTPMISQQPQTEVMPQMSTQDGTMMLQQMSPDMQRQTEEQNLVGEATPQMSENAGKARFKGGSVFDKFDMLGLGGGHDKGKIQKHGPHSDLRPTIINYYYNAGGRPSTYSTGSYGGGSSGYDSSSKPSYGASYGSGASGSYGTPNAYAGNAPSYGSYGASAGGSHSSGSYRTAVGDDEIRAMLQEHSQMKMMSDTDRNPVNTTVVPNTTIYQETSLATENINQKQPTSQTETSSISDKPKSTTTSTITKPTNSPTTTSPKLTRLDCKLRLNSILAKGKTHKGDCIRQKRNANYGTLQAIDANSLNALRKTYKDSLKEITLNPDEDPAEALMRHNAASIRAALEEANKAPMEINTGGEDVTTIEGHNNEAYYDGVQMPILNHVPTHLKVFSEPTPYVADLHSRRNNYKIIDSANREPVNVEPQMQKIQLQECETPKRKQDHMKSVENKSFPPAIVDPEVLQHTNVSNVSETQTSESELRTVLELIKQQMQTCCDKCRDRILGNIKSNIKALHSYESLQKDEATRMPSKTTVSASNSNSKRCRYDDQFEEWLREMEAKGYESKYLTKSHHWQYLNSGKLALAIESGEYEEEKNNRVSKETSEQYFKRYTPPGNPMHDKDRKSKKLSNKSRGKAFGKKIPDLNYSIKEHVHVVNDELRHLKQNSEEVTLSPYAMRGKFKSSSARKHSGSAPVTVPVKFNAMSQLRSSLSNTAEENKAKVVELLSLLYDLNPRTESTTNGKPAQLSVVVMPIAPANTTAIPGQVATTARARTKRIRSRRKQKVENVTATKVEQSSIAKYSSVNPESLSPMDPENVGSIFSFSPNILTPFMELQSVPLYESDPWNHKSYDLHYPLYVGGGSYEPYLNSKRLKRNSRGYTNNILTPSILDHFLKVRLQFEKRFPELYKSLRDQQRALNLTRVFVKPPVIPKTVMYPPAELGAAELLPSDFSSIQNIDPTTKSEDVTDYFLFDDDD